MNHTNLTNELKGVIKGIAPDAVTILFGSEARGEAGKESDIDILILIDRDQISPEEEDCITTPIYDLEIKTGVIISPIVMTRKDWEASKRKTLFYHNVMKDGIVL